MNKEKLINIMHIIDRMVAIYNYCDKISKYGHNNLNMYIIDKDTMKHLLKEEWIYLFRLLNDHKLSKEEWTHVQDLSAQKIKRKNISSVDSCFNNIHYNHQHHKEEYLHLFMYK